MTNEQLAARLTDLIKTEIGGLRTEMRTEIGRIDGRLRAVNARITKLNNQMMSQFEYVIQEIRRLDNSGSDSARVDEDSPRA